MDIKMNKKAISPLIATVLLIGFTIVIATLVFTWNINLYKNLEDQTKIYRSQELINYDLKNILTEDSNIEFCFDNQEKQVTGIIIKVYGSIGTETILKEEIINPFETKCFSVAYTASIVGFVERIEIIPQSYDPTQKITLTHTNSNQFRIPLQGENKKPVMLFAYADKNIIKRNENISFYGFWQDPGDEVKLLIANNSEFLNCDFNNNIGCLCSSSSSFSELDSCIYKAIKPGDLQWYARACDFEYCSDEILRNLTSNTINKVYFDYMVHRSNTVNRTPDSLGIKFDNPKLGKCEINTCQDLEYEDIRFDDTIFGYTNISTGSGTIRSYLRYNYNLVGIPINNISNLNFTFKGYGSNNKDPRNLTIYIFNFSSNSWTLLGSIRNDIETKFDIVIENANFNDLVKNNISVFMAYDYEADYIPYQETPKPPPPPPRVCEPGDTGCIITGKFLLDLKKEVNYLVISLLILIFIIILILKKQRKLIFILMFLILAINVNALVSSYIENQFTQLQVVYNGYENGQFFVNNSKPQIENIPDFEMFEGSLFSYTVNASDPENDTLIFFSNNNLFPINELTGLIEFTASSSMVGINLVNISVSDGYLIDLKIVKFIINRIETPSTGPTGGGGGGGGGGGKTPMTYILDFRKADQYNIGPSEEDIAISLFSDVDKYTFFINYISSNKIILTTDFNDKIIVEKEKIVYLDFDHDGQNDLSIEYNGGLTFTLIRRPIEIKKPNIIIRDVRYEPGLELPLIKKQIDYLWIFLIIFLALLIYILYQNKKIQKIIDFAKKKRKSKSK